VLSLIFPSDLHISEVFLHESCSRTPGAGIQHGYALIKLGDIISGGSFRAAAFDDRAPGREKTQLAVAGSLGIGSNNRYIAFDKVRPIFDPLRVSLSDHEHNGGVIRQR